MLYALRVTDGLAGTGGGCRRQLVISKGDIVDEFWATLEDAVATDDCDVDTALVVVMEGVVIGISEVVEVGECGVDLLVSN